MATSGYANLHQLLNEQSTAITTQALADFQKAMDIFTAANLTNYGAYGTAIDGGNINSSKVLQEAVNKSKFSAEVESAFKKLKNKVTKDLALA